MTNENSILADSTTNLTSPAKGKVQEIKKKDAENSENTEIVEDLSEIDDREKEKNPLNPNGQSAKDKERALIVSITQGRHRETWNQKVEFLLAVIGFAVDLGGIGWSVFEDDSNDL
jgi:hypothetical protein